MFEHPRFSKHQQGKLAVSDSDHNTSTLTAVFNQVQGFLSLPEAELLYRLASECPPHSNIIEIGSFQGRSTVCLGLGAKASGATVWAIDPHFECVVSNTEFGMADNLKYYEAVAHFQVGDVVKTLNITSRMAALVLHRRVIDLLWIDGAHDYESVSEDFRCFAGRMNPDGKVVLHDTSGHFPDITRFLNVILATLQWTIDQQIDSITVLKRA